MGIYSPNSQEPIWTHLKQIEALNQTLPWTLACILILQIMSSLIQLFFYKGLNQLIFPPIWCHVCLVLILPLFGHEPSSKSHVSNLWLSQNRIALFHWILEGCSSSKVAPSVRKQPLHQPIHNEYEAIVNMRQYAMREHMNVTLGQIIVVDQSIASNAQLVASQQKVVI